MRSRFHLHRLECYIFGLKSFVVLSIALISLAARHLPILRNTAESSRREAELHGCPFQISGVKNGKPSGTWYDLKECYRDSLNTWRVKVANTPEARAARTANRTRARVPTTFIRRNPASWSSRQLPMASELFVTTYAGGVGKGVRDGHREDALFEDIVSIAVGRRGDIYVSECHGCRLRRIAPNGEVTTLCGDDITLNAKVEALMKMAKQGLFDPRRPEEVDGNANEMTLNAPHGICTNFHLSRDGEVDREENKDLVFVADSGRSRIRLIKQTATGFHLETLVGRHTSSSRVLEPPAGDDDPMLRRNGILNYPMGVALGPDGSLIVADSMNFCIRKISGIVNNPLNGYRKIISKHSTDSYSMPGYEEVVDTETPELVAGCEGTQSFADGDGTHARFVLPVSLTVDNKGYTWVSDAASIDPFSILSPNLANRGSSEGVHAPRQAYAQGKHQRIRLISPGGVVTTIGGGELGGNRDGWAPSARLCMPQGLATDPWRKWDISDECSHHFCYVADMFNFCIRRIAHNEITTIAGRSDRPGYQDGSAHLAKFRMPNDVAVGPDGSLYVSDNGNFAIRKISLRHDLEG